MKSVRVALTHLKCLSPLLNCLLLQMLSAWGSSPGPVLWQGSPDWSIECSEWHLLTEEDSASYPPATGSNALPTASPKTSS